MMIITILAITVYLSIAGRFHGGGFNTGAALSFAAFWNKYAPSWMAFNTYSDHMDWPRWIRTVIFGMPYIFLGWIAPQTAALGVNIGHDNFWNMGTAPNSPDKNWLGKLVSFTGLKPDSLAYCTLGMAIKGAITAAGTLSPCMIACHAVALPLAYYIGVRTRWGTVFAEYLSCALYGLSFFAFVYT